MFGMVGAVGLLTAGCIFDVQSKKIPLFILGAGGIWSVAELIIKAVETGISPMLLFAIPAILPGAVLLILCFCAVSSSVPIVQIYFSSSATPHNTLLLQCISLVVRLYVQF